MRIVQSYVFGSLVFKTCCKIDETVCDLPDPVAPTIAKCLLKIYFHLLV